MTAPGNTMLIMVLTFGIVVSTTYALGRIQQWHRHGATRDKAYRNGYDEAAASLLRMVRNADTGEGSRKAVVQTFSGMPALTGRPSDASASNN